MNTQPKLSVIVCTYNREGCILAALNSLAAQTLPVSDYEVLLVNNNSTDSTPDLCEHFGDKHPALQYRYMVELKQGLSHARNRGVTEAGGDVLIFMDDDAVAEPDYLEQIYRFFEQTTDAVAFGGRIYPNFESKRPRWMSRFLVPLTSSLDMGNSIRLFKGRSYPIGANMGFKRRVFAQYGHFNPDLGRKGTGMGGAEEKDLFYRIMNSGEKVYYLPDAVVHHYVPDARLTYAFFKRQAIGIGSSERLRAKAVSTGEYMTSIFSEGVKWGGSIVLSVFYLLSFRPAKAWRLPVFRWYVSKGLLGFCSA